jgi:hypothetical protein
MSQDTSLPLVNINDDVDRKVNDFFNTYFLPKAKINENDYELIKSFCISRTSNTSAAAALTAAIINVMNELDLYADDVIDQFKASSDPNTIPLFLNLSRKGVSLLGYKNTRIVPPRVKQQVIT